MQLTQYTDYSFRVLLYLAERPGSLTTVSEIAEFHGISRNHLIKVIHNLSIQNFISTRRGRNGGMMLSRPPEEINLGDVVRKTEPNFYIVECFNTQNNGCRVTANCALKSVFFQAQQAFLQVMDNHLLSDALKPKKPGVQFISMPVSTKKT